MRSPKLIELPLPPPQKSGWPWTEESPHLPDTMPNGSNWPRISIVTPSLNQGQYIEETIRSVILQGYPNLEYVIIDGGSSDKSVDIIKKYENWITYWISEKDQGQTQAINKGFRRINGEIVAWLNSDDFYSAEAFLKVAIKFMNFSDVDMIYGDMLEIFEETGRTRLIKGHAFSIIDQIRSKFIMQPTCFWRSNLFSKIGYLDETYQYVFDLEYFIRAGFRVRIRYLPVLLSFFRIHSGAKTRQINTRSTHEGIRMYENLFSNSQLPINISKLKGRVLGHWYERLAHLYLRESLYLDARRSFRQAIFLAPWRLQNLTLLLYILDCFFHTKFGHSIQLFSLKIREIFKLKPFNIS